MYKMQIYQNTIEAVVMETEIEREKILSGCKEEETIDARSLLIRLLYEQGLYPPQISKLTGICARSVNRFIISFKERCNSRKIMRLNYENVRNKLGLA